MALSHERHLPVDLANFDGLAAHLVAEEDSMITLGIEGGGLADPFRFVVFFGSMSSSTSTSFESASPQ